jgi:hypothetical protein
LTPNKSALSTKKRGLEKQTILFDDFIEFSSLVDVFEVICQTGATAVFDAHADEFGRRLVEHFCETGDGGGG